MTTALNALLPSLPPLLGLPLSLPQAVRAGALAGGLTGGLKSGRTDGREARQPAPAQGAQARPPVSIRPQAAVARLPGVLRAYEPITVRYRPGML